MSFTTHSEGNGVYTYQDYNNIYHCVDCTLEFKNTDAFIEHLKEHKQNGCNIPDEVFMHIKEDE